MLEERPYSWLGVANEPDFFYSDCGHLVGCSDPTFDLGPKRRELREADYMRCLGIAMRTGEHGRRSSCRQDENVCAAIDAVAVDPSEENHLRAIQARWDLEERLARDDD